MKIAFSGTHGTGKTTSCFKLATSYKMNTNYSIGISEEVARLCPYQINENSDWISQMWMFSAIVKSELTMEKLYDIVICDRSIADCVAYSYFSDKELYKYLLELSKLYITTYDEIFVKDIHNEYQFDDGIRSMDKQFRKDIHDKLLEIYHELDYKVIMV